MKYEQLRKLLANHESLKFPSHSGNEVLEDWLIDLDEFDGHYVGISKSVLNEKEISKLDLSDLGEMKARLKNITTYSLEEEKIMHTCESYLNSLEEIINEINKICERNRIS